jgi:aryl-alcohol dehydrogenase-like predicted oxidoreductase
MNRREFLKQTTATAAMLGCFPASLSAIERDTTAGKIERRVLGQTGDKLSIVAFGGYVLNRASDEQSAQWVREAFEAGVNHFDVAPEYGTAEERMGPALETFRQQVFLSCKTAQRHRTEAASELDRSLKRLRTDHIDLYQFHHVSRLDEVEAIFSDDGAMKAFEQAKKDGKIRHLGFSAHSVEAALAMMERYRFDSIMFPVNYATWNAGEFGPQVLAKAQELRMGILALKALAKQPLPPGADRSAHPNCWYQPMTDPDEAMMGLRFTLSHPVTTALTPASEPCMKLALKLAAQFTPLKPEEAEAMKQKGLAATPLFSYRANG